MTRERRLKSLERTYEYSGIYQAAENIARELGVPVAEVLDEAERIAAEYAGVDEDTMIARFAAEHEISEDGIRADVRKIEAEVAGYGRRPTNGL